MLVRISVLFTLFLVSSAGCCFVPSSPAPSPAPPAISTSPAAPASPAPAPAPTPVVAAAPARDFDRFLGETFTLGAFGYLIRSVERPTTVGNRAVREEAARGSTFVLVNYTETNQGRETVTGMEGPMLLRDRQGRTFRPSSRAMTALAMSGRGDLGITELQPGVPRDAVVAFELPEEPNQRLILVVQERGFGSRGETRVLLRTEPQERSLDILERVIFPFSSAARERNGAAARGLFVPERASMPDAEVLQLLADYQTASGGGRASLEFDRTHFADGAWSVTLAVLDQRERPTGRRIVFQVVENGSGYLIRALDLGAS